AAIFVILWKKSETFRKIVTAAWNGIKTAAMAVFNFLKTYFVTMFNFYKTIFTNAIRFLLKAWDAIKKLPAMIGTVFTSIFNFFKGLPARLIKIGTNIIDGLIDGIKSGIEKLKGIFSWITDHIPDW